MAMIERPSLKGFGPDEAVGSFATVWMLVCWRVIGWFLFLGFVLFVVCWSFFKDLSKILRPKNQ